jgi:acyl carrier protein
VSEALILDIVRSLARERLRLEVPIDMTSDFRRDLKLDSLKLLELLVAVENRFEVCLTPDEEAALGTVGDVVRFIAGHAAA